MIDKKKRIKKGSKYVKIEVDIDLCIGAGTCEVLAPEMFKLDDEGKAYIGDENSHDDEDVLEAAMSCPVLAIRLYDKDGKLVFPK